MCKQNFWLARIYNFHIFLLNCLYSTSTWYFNTFSSCYTNIIYLKSTILTQNQQNSVHPLHNGIRFRSRKHLSTQIFFLFFPLNKMVGSSVLLHHYACMHNFHTNYIRNLGSHQKHSSKSYDKEDASKTKKDDRWITVGEKHASYQMEILVCFYHHFPQGGQIAPLFDQQHCTIEVMQKVAQYAWEKYKYGI